jgi:hypothetical protein
VEACTKRRAPACRAASSRVAVPDHVHGRVEGRIGDGPAHVDLGGQVEDDLGPRRGQRVGHRGRVHHAALVQPRAVPKRTAQIFLTAGREIVEDGHVMPPREQGVNEV